MKLDKKPGAAPHCMWCQTAMVPHERCPEVTFCPDCDRRSCQTCGEQVLDATVRECDSCGEDLSYGQA